MKSKMFTLAAILTGSTSLMAQTTDYNTTTSPVATTTTSTTTNVRGGWLQSNRWAENPGGLFVIGGVNLANISRGTDGSTSSQNQYTSWHAGVLGDIPLNEFLSIQPGVMWTGKGSKTERTVGTTRFRSEFNPQYIEVPVNLALKIPFGDNSPVNFFVAAGPYAAVGVAGKYTTRITNGTTNAETTVKDNISFNNDDPFTAGQEDASASRVRRFDYGLNGSAGFTFGRFMVRGQYGWGLTKISSIEDNNSNGQNKHRVLNFSLGVRI